MTRRELTDAERSVIALCVETSGLEAVLYYLSDVCDDQGTTVLDVDTPSADAWNRRSYMLGDLARRCEVEHAFKVKP